MAYLQQSTHFNNWIFSRDELARIHRLRQLKASRALRLEQQAFAAAKAAAAAAAAAGGTAATAPTRPPRKPRSFAALVPASSTAVRDVNDWNDDIFSSDTFAALDAAEQEEALAMQELTPPLELLSLEQEQVVREFYEAKIQESCSQLFRTSDKVKCCAVMLYKRFYLSNSVMEFHPKFIVPTAIYVAGKVEEQYISVDTIAEQLHVDHKHVIAHEMVLLEGVRFQLIMYHPFRALLGFVDDFRGYAKAMSKELALDTLQKLHSTSCVVVNELLLTDAPLTHYPPFLALAALAHVVEELGSALPDDAARTQSALTQADVLEYIRRSKFAQSEQVAGVTQQLEVVRRAYSAVKAAQVEQATDADARAKELKALYKALKRFHHDDDASSSKDSKTSNGKDGSKKSKKDKKRKKDDKDGKDSGEKKKKAKKAKKDKQES